MYCYTLDANLGELSDMYAAARHYFWVCLWKGSQRRLAWEVVGRVGKKHSPHGQAPSN